jgi:predicted DNA-binding transcriptional regulator YafY
MPVKEIKLSDLIQLSPEEAHILHTLLMSISGDSQVLVNLEKKLAALFDATSVTEIIGNKTSAENLMRLREAMDEKVQVVLKNYESGNTMTISDRLVEPYGFSTNYCDVYAFEVATGRNKTFKISRIGYVMPLQTDWKYEDQHEAIEPDCFRMNGEEDIKVKMELSLRAKNLLIEEYPLAEKDIYHTHGTWIFESTVHSLEGVGRFVIGLAGEIRLIDSPALEEYVKEYIRKNLTVYITESET